MRLTFLYAKHGKLGVHLNIFYWSLNVIMRLNISHKLLAINASIIFSLTGVFVSFSYFSSDSLFSNALNGIDTEVMKELTIPLKEHYRENRSWSGYIQNNPLWQETVNKGFFTTFFALMEQARVNKLSGPMGSKTPSPQYSQPKMEFSFGTFLQRTALLDRNKSVLIESEMASKSVSYQMIRLNGEVIGWLRVGKINVDMFPLANFFFKQQLSISTWASVLGGVIAIILSYFLSGHITNPIKKLTYGAQKIAKRDFNGIMEVHTKDEIEELAKSFNFISKELKRYESRQKQWLKDISHELRTPLTILTCEISSMCENITKFDVSAVESLQEEVKQVKRLVDDLEDLSNIDNMNFNLKDQKIDLHKLINHYLDRYQEKFSSREIELRSDLYSSSIFIIGDSDRMAQVLVNLLENSIHYTDSPGILWVKTEIVNNEAVLVFEDSGPGVPLESTDKIFDRLYRVDNSRSRATGGTGLGLSICEGIVKAHGGSVMANNNDKGGLDIRITLPI